MKRMLSVWFKVGCERLDAAVQFSSSVTSLKGCLGVTMKRSVSPSSLAMVNSKTFCFCRPKTPKMDTSRSLRSLISSPVQTDTVGKNARKRTTSMAEFHTMSILEATFHYQLDLPVTIGRALVRKLQDP